MGLDNSIEIKRYNDKAFKEFPGSWIHTYDTKNTYVELCYMRKWWGTRNEIVAYLTHKYPSDKTEYDWDLSIEDIKAIKDIFVGWLDEERWEDESDSIWDWEDNIAENIGQKISDCNKLMRLMEKYPDMLVQFVDSY